MSSTTPSTPSDEHDVVSCKTYAITISRGGTSSVVEYDRDCATGVLTYVGHDWRNEANTARLVEALQSPISIFTSPRATPEAPPHG